MTFYDPRVVHAHGSAESEVFLVNEAPGPIEAHFGIPCVGRQGANLYWALRKAEIPWALERTVFSWPIKVPECYKFPNKVQRQFELRNEFLQIREKHITCSNAYPRWPRTDEITCDWQDPAQTDVLSESNVIRLKNEIGRRLKIILVCGEYAWMACHATNLPEPSKREGSSLSSEELACMNQRLSSSFVAGWYMGHTRRWSLNTARTSAILKNVARVAGWSR